MSDEFDLSEIINHTSEYDKILLFNHLVECDYDINQSLEEFFGYTTKLFECDSLVQFIGDSGHLLIAGERYDDDLIIIVSNSEEEIFDYIDMMILNGFILQKIDYKEFELRKDLKHHYYYRNLTLVDLPLCMN